MKALLDFANLKEPYFDSLSMLFRKHKIIFTTYGVERGFDEIILTEHNHDVPFHFSTMPKGNVGTDRKKMFLYRNEENEKLLAKCISKSQSKYRQFLNSCANGGLDLEFINERIAKIGSKDLMLNPTNDPYKVSFELNFRPTNIENYLDIYEIIYPLWRGEGEEFSRIKICKHCDNFFYARSLKAKFCSVKCKNAFNYQRTA